MKFCNLVNNRYGRWIVIAHAGQDKHKNSFWLCRCDCGNEKYVRGGDLKNGATTSCGCSRRKTPHLGSTLTQSFLKEYLTYNSETGVFTWINCYSPHTKVGSVAGSDCDGYTAIGFLGKSYKAHRLVWMYVYGAFPKYEIDHINGIRHDNRICNLREATHLENMKNVKVRVNNKSGFKGVHWNRTKRKWVSYATADGKRCYLGQFNTPEEASVAYEAFAKEKFGEFYINTRRIKK